MLDLIKKNEEMLKNKAYNLADQREMLKISSLSNYNDYDKYLIACCLCNYDIEEKADARNLRMTYFKSTNNGKIDGFEHPITDYQKVVTDVKCKNTGNVNKFGLYEYEINVNDKDMINDFWAYKTKNCLKYVDSKTYPDKIIVSISRDQLDNFTKLLDQYMIDYDSDDIESGLFYKNKSVNKLVDLNTLTLPFKPYPYQIEDAEKIIKKKRLLLGHEMGCVSGKSKVNIEISVHCEQMSICKAITVEELFNIFKINNNNKVESSVGEDFEFMPIANVLDKGIKDTIRISVDDTFVECTTDHPICTPNGWVNAEDLSIGDVIVTKNGNKKIISIEPANTQHVYDIVINDIVVHNFVCNNIVVHNCGKTFIYILVGSSINEPKLVICPESLRINWFREIKNVTPDADVQIQFSNEAPHFGKDWTIIGYASVSKFLDRLKEFNCVFVDECHACKSVNNWGKPSSKRAAAVIEIAENAEYCYLLTGTPMPSHNVDLYNILRMLKCEAFDFNSKWAFLNYANKFCDPKVTYFGKDFSGNSNSDLLHGLLSNIMVRRLKKDVLPHLKKQRQFIPIEPKFKSEYKDIEHRIFHPREEDTYMGLAMTGRKLLSSYKLDTAIDLAESLIDSGESVVIVTNFIDSADKLKEHFKDKCCEIRGGMSDTEKQFSIDEFQKKMVPVCILNMQAGGVGITLTAAHTMIIVDYAWVPSDMVQVEDRICRSGQTEQCMIYYVYCVNSTLDSLFIEMVSNKSENIDLVVDNDINTFNLNEEKEVNATFIEALKAKIAAEKPKKTRKKKGA